MPNHALYYPEWHINDPVFLAESLLYWDRIACLVPFAEFKPAPWHPDKEMRKVITEAHEKYVSPVVPTEDQKQRVHQRLVAFAQTNPPDWWRPANLTLEHRQSISAHKFAPESIELLRKSGWAAPTTETDRLGLHVVGDSTADLLVFLLADECSSPTMPPITEDPEAFLANCNSLLAEVGAPTGLTREPRDRGQAAPTEQGELAFLLARIPHFGFEKDRLDVRTFRSLLKARNDPDIDQLRHTFRKKVDENVERLRRATGGEQELIGKEFQSEFEANRVRFQRDLKRCGLGAIASKEGAVAILVGIAAGTLTLGLGLAFGLAGGLLAHRLKRREVFEKHWSSWVFSTTTPKFSFL